MIINNRGAVSKALSVLRREIVDKCDICHGMDPGCKCRFKMMIYERAAVANVPIGLLPKVFADFGVGQENNEAVMEVKKAWHDIIYNIREFIKNGPLVFVSGPNGTGKTMMSCIAIKSAIASQLTAQYILFNQLISSFLGKNEKNLLEHSVSRDLLVIDEVGKEYKKVNQFGDYDINNNMASYAKYIFENVVKLRSDAGLSTILISNDDEEEIQARYGGADSALVSVLKSSKTKKIFHTGIDFRSL